MTEQPITADTLVRITRELPVMPVPDSTSDFQSISFPQPVRLPSFFTGHQLHPVHKAPIPAEHYYETWIPAVFLFSFLLLAWVNVYFHKRFRLILSASFSKRFMNQLTREGDLFSERISMVLSIIYLLIFSLLLYEIYDLILKPVIQIPFTNYKLYLLIIAGLTLYWIVKIFAIRFLGSVFKTNQTTHAYLLNILIAVFLTAVVLLPVMLFVVYLKSQIMLYVALVAFGMIFLMQFFKGFLIGISLTRFSYFYLFVYLCSLEILPWLVMVKLFMRNYF